MHFINWKVVMNGCAEFTESANNEEFEISSCLQHQFQPKHSKYVYFHLLVPFLWFSYCAKMNENQHLPVRQKRILKLWIAWRLFGNLHLNQAYTWRFVIFQYTWSGLPLTVCSNIDSMCLEFRCWLIFFSFTCKETLCFMYLSDKHSSKLKGWYFHSSYHTLCYCLA